MGITGLIPFLDKASRRANIDEFRGCTVAIDSYCWLHKGAFACAERLVRGEDTDIHIKYCLKYVTMLLSRNIKPILVFDGRHLPAKSLTEAKRRESRNISKKRAAELLSLGQTEEARSFMRRSVDITHKMALDLIRECRKRNVDCVVAPYEADAQLAYLNMRNIAHLVITEDSDLILFGCTKVLFKMDLDGTGTLVETVKLPLVMRCPIERYSFDKFRQMCIMSGCDYLPSLPGIGLVKARQFVNATQDSNFANALKKLPSFFNKASLSMTDEYRECFLKAEATFKHMFVYDPIDRRMVRLTEPDDEDVERALCVNAGELLEPDVAFQLALGNLDPFTLQRVDDWHPDQRETSNNNTKSTSWKEVPAATHPSVWSADFKLHLQHDTPWRKEVKKPDPIIPVDGGRVKKKVVNLVSKYVPETQDYSLSIEALSSMYCTEPATKKQRLNEPQDSQTELHSQEQTNPLNQAMIQDTISDETEPNLKAKSPILKNRERRSAALKRLSKFPRTFLDGNVVESKFFSPPSSEGSTEPSSEEDRNAISIEETSEKIGKPFVIDTQCFEIPDSQPDSGFSGSQKENSSNNSPVMVTRKSPVLQPSPRCRNPFRVRPLAELIASADVSSSQDSVIENTYPAEGLATPIGSQDLFGEADALKSEPVTILGDCLEAITCEPDILDMFTDESDNIDIVNFISQPTHDVAVNSQTNSDVAVSCQPTPDVAVSSQPTPDVAVCSQPTNDVAVSSQPTPDVAVSSQPTNDVAVSSQPTHDVAVSSQPTHDVAVSSQKVSSVAQKKATCKVPGLRRTTSLPSNQPTLLSKFGFQRTVLKK